MALVLWNLVCYISLHKTDYRFNRHSDENLRKISDNWKISQFWKNFIISHVQPLHSFNSGLSLFTSGTIESPTPIFVEMQESMEHIYPSIQTLPNNAPNTVSSA